MRSWYCEVMVNMGHSGWVFVDYRCLVVVLVGKFVHDFNG